MKPTLAEVFAALELPGEEDGMYPTAAKSMAVEYLLANREMLERAELERAARKVAGASDATPVRVLPTRDAPEVLTVHYEDSDCRMIEVGRDWRPEVKRG